MVRMIFSIVHSFFIVISVIIAFQQTQTVVLTALNLFSSLTTLQLYNYIAPASLF